MEEAMALLRQTPLVAGSDLSAVSEIASFYAGRSVMITGATGFMGKVLVEKLLRSCPQIGRIYLLMRTKRGQEPKARLNDLLSAKVRLLFQLNITLMYL
jgi:FlaA1/EpsC-like NDP-sugar epimerase